VPFPEIFIPLRFQRTVFDFLDSNGSFIFPLCSPFASEALRFFISGFAENSVPLSNQNHQRVHRRLPPPPPILPRLIIFAGFEFLATSSTSFLPDLRESAPLQDRAFTSPILFPRPQNDRIPFFRFFLVDLTSLHALHRALDLH